MIFVGVPAVGPPTWGLLDSLMSLRAGQFWQFRKQAGYGGVAVACNNLVRGFLETDATHFVLMANDAKVHPDTIGRLLSWDEDIVAALAFTKLPPIVPGVYMESADGVNWPSAVNLVRRWIVEHPELVQRNAPAILERPPDGSLLPVKRLGTHITAIKRRVFETLAFPWFESLDHLGGGEDFYFCETALKAGFQPHVDLSVVAGHMLGEWCIGALDFMMWAEVTTWPDAIKEA